MKTSPIRVRKPAKPAQNKLNKKLADVFRSLADENRLQILRLLMAEGTLNVSRICEELGESQPAVSHHLTQLKHAGLVDFERDGKFNLYFIASEPIKMLLDHFFPTSSKSQQTISFGELEVTFRIR
ncbi:ArsR/SmtB family transcription factor [Zavarzinella formosa]|uniref:ArsR/SmtB family transcription factor n=1 Tax=Zavarzinella formosa TaxID=360055 RepID=UPI00030070B2|nr:metalloregulator ArsR/SmtB family transcription factor [Zavarzinella formosa]